MILNLLNEMRKNRCEALLIILSFFRSGLNNLCGFCSERFPLPLGAWNGLRYFIVALPVPSINLLNKFNNI